MRRLIAIAAMMLAPTFGASTANAELKICNETHEAQSVALGYKGETDWTSEGWWTIEPGSCMVPVSGDLKIRYYYYHAHSRSGSFRGQDYWFCTSDAAFSIVGDTDCKSRGYDEAEFREIDTGETALSFTLTIVGNGSSNPAGSAKGPGGGNNGANTRLTGGSSESAGSITQSITEVPQAPSIVIDTSALQSDLTPGQYGKPVTLNALFQGCELGRGRPLCSFHADGRKLRVYHNGPTPKELLFALEEMEVNTAIRLEADEVQAEGFDAAIVVRSVTPQPNRDPMADLRATLQGDWRSAGNRRSIITIRGSEIFVRFDGEFRTTRYLQLAQSCPGARGSGPVLLQRTEGERSAKCYNLARADGAQLTLEPVNGGPALRFNRP